MFTNNIRLTIGFGCEVWMQIGEKCGAFMLFACEIREERLDEKCGGAFHKLC